MPTSSNLDPFLNELAARARNNLERARTAGEESLQAFRDFGLVLIEAEQLLPRGRFGKWVKDQFDCGKSWSARVRTLARAWSDFASAKIWAEALGRVLGRREYSVDGALELISQWRQATNPTDFPGPQGRQKRETLLDKLRHELDAEREARRNLENEMKALKARRARTGAPVSVDAGTQNRAIKVAGLWTRGATDGERDAAEYQLRRIADGLDISFPSLLRACKINAPTDWTSRRAA